MTGTIDDSLYIQLEWSAPGDDYDRGRGKYWLLYYKILELSPNPLSKCNVSWDHKLVSRTKMI